MERRPRFLISEEKIHKGSHIIVLEYYDNDDLEVTIYDELGEVVAYIDILDGDEEEPDTGFNFNLN